ncbi:5'-3' exonuclease [Solicola sp. PLA-1-18]|uniref:5'-3' exonuclease n=1 Tax=Solicola sp. PLA-1-18 TaxID=3380532 RepID=UPI003B7E83EE
MSPTGPRLMLLDTASLYFRAFYGVPDTFKAPDGTPVNAVRGLLDFIATLSSGYHPDAIAACWDDDWRPAWRVELLPSYKEHRVAEVRPGVDEEEAPDELGVQVPLIREVLALLGISVVGAAAAEADDVIGTLATRWEGPVEVVTGDRDLFQLVDDDAGIRVLYTARGVGRHDKVDRAWVHEKYGVDPDRYVDFAVMRGDPSDGLPGVTGIGDKTAARLLKEFGDLDGILAAADDRRSSITPRVRTNLQAGHDYVARGRKVVAVDREVECGEPGTVEALTLTPLDVDARAAVVAFGETWGLGGSVERVLSALP